MALNTEASPEPFLPATLLLQQAQAGATSQEEGRSTRDLWDPSSQRYGLAGIMRCRDAMLPIAKPPEMVNFKLLVCPSFNPESHDVASNEPRESRRTGERQGKGRGKDKDKGKPAGRFVADMGQTEVMTNTQRGQWWINCSVQDGLPVIVRELFSLQSQEVWKVPPGHYVQQAGPAEVFISGPARGLQRMPVLPRGWVTVDAVSVGGPKYLDQVRVPRWKVVFRSGSAKGDIVVRDGLSLESEEVSVLLYGSYVEQSGPQEVLGDGIVRMPITFSEISRTASGNAQVQNSGWVTCDATAQGGPKFFEPYLGEVEPPPPQTQLAGGQSMAADDGQAAGQFWDKNRIWKVVNLAREDKRLAVTVRAEPFQPGTRRIPAEDNLVRWMGDGDIVEQVGHSKKVRGYMVMPIRVVSSSDPDADANATGWVTRRLVDKTRDSPDETWFVEIRNGEEAERGDRQRKPRRKQGAQAGPEA